MSPADDSSDSSSLLPSGALADRLWRWRFFKERAARVAVGWGGMMVIVALILIFVYLLYVVVPLFQGASMEEGGSVTPVAATGDPLYLYLEEQNQVAMRLAGDGSILFFRVVDGSTVDRVELPLTAEVTAMAAADPLTGVVALGLADGKVMVFRHRYRQTFPNDRMVIVPQVEFPFGEEPFTVDAEGRAVRRLAIQDNEEEATLVAAVEGGVVRLVHFAKESSFLDEDEVSLERSDVVVPSRLTEVRWVRLNLQQHHLYLVDDLGQVEFFDLRDKASPTLLQRLVLSPPERRITAMEFLTGGISLMVGDETGRITQWFPVRGEEGTQKLTRIRDFDAQRDPIVAIAAESGRKGFVALDARGRMGVYHATAHRVLGIREVAPAGASHIALSPRADGLLVQAPEGDLRLWHLHNEHPEVSWSSLWGKVWYEGHEAPKWLWQSSSSSQDFEPKLSLTPISFGTLKAAFYAMIIAAPLAILGAIYTAYFMAPGMRRKIKPTIEIMEALPTVILGFLAGLWLAPTVEANLPGIFSLLLLTPLAILLASWVWYRLPHRINGGVPEGWDALLLVPVVLAVAWLCFSLSKPVEVAFFGGDMRLWLTSRGIDFDQRNSLVVGLAMGFAVIPTIFSITEDAIFSVPKHLTQGSLALGATPWQTLSRVVILTASPGIFSAVMIGLGRAVGETMIVLMATGNTPVMDWSIFQGMRTLSANIAVEVPESEVGSTHYRVLFLAGLVLFVFTFVINTLAEVIRQRLRNKYSSL